MSSIKDFVANGFINNPKRYGCDDGDLNIINDCFEERGYELITREQYQALQTVLRERNKFLANNPNYDLRQKHTPPLFTQLSIYDFLDNDTATQTRKLTRYIAGDENRLNQSNSRIKKSVRGVDTEHISAVKVMYSLFHSEPKLKKLRINGDSKHTEYTGVDGDLDEKMETILYDEVAGE